MKLTIKRNEFLRRLSFTAQAVPSRSAEAQYRNYLIDVKGLRKGTMFFQVVGMNSITIYMAQRIIGFWPVTGFFFKGLSGVVPESCSGLVMNVGYFAVCWLFLYFLYRKKCFLKV